MANQPVLTGYLYDAEGHRVAKGTLPSLSCDMSNLQVTAEYFIGPDGQTKTEVDPSPAGDMWARTEVSAAGQYLATYIPDGIHYAVTDWLRSKRVQVNPNNTLAANGVEETCTSYPFGDQLNCYSGIDASPRHYTGKERDAESGLDYFGARYYGSSMGRFMSPDYSMNSVILELPQSWNKYSYVLNRPLYASDPDGRCPWCVGAIVGGVVEGGFDAGKQWYQKGSLSKVDWKEVGASAAGGAVAGALAVATGGASLVESAVVGDIAAGGTSNVVGSIVTRALDPNTKSDDVLSAGEISKDAVAGFVGGGVGHLAGDSIHLPDDPVSSGVVSARRRLPARTPDGRFANYNGLLRNQITRAGVAGSGATHTTNGGFDIYRWMMHHPNQPCFSTSAIDNHGNSTGSSGCQ